MNIELRNTFVSKIQENCVCASLTFFPISITLLPFFIPNVISGFANSVRDCPKNIEDAFSYF